MAENPDETGLGERCYIARGPAESAGEPTGKTTGRSERFL
jgi:hypothetical protein